MDLRHYSRRFVRQISKAVQSGLIKKMPGACSVSALVFKALLVRAQVVIATLLVLTGVTLIRLLKTQQVDSYGREGWVAAPATPKPLLVVHSWNRVLIQSDPSENEILFRR